MGLFQSVVARSLLAEFLSESVATFFFTILAGMTFGAGVGVVGSFIAAMAVGLGAIVLHQSEKAHLNPVVSIAVSLCDIDFGWTNLFLRILAQILGAILGGLLSVDAWRQVTLDFSVSATSTGYRTLIFSILFTALLCVVYLRTRGTSVLAPVVHGLMYFVGILVSGSLFAQGNALLNPALGLGLVIGSSSFSKLTKEGDIWLFIIGPFIGALLGVVFYQLTNALDDDYESGSENVATTEEVVRTTVYENQGHPGPNPGYGGGPVLPNPGYGAPNPGYGNQL